MAFLHRSIQQLTKDDIDRLVLDQEPEDSELEFKRQVEIDTAGGVRDGSRNDIAREIVAFANADGGTLVIGIEESTDEPKRAAAIWPVPNCHELAERLRRSIIEIIEPKLPMLHSRAVEFEAGAGVVVFVIPRSLRAPHRVNPLRDCFRRVGSESRKMTMREIQELTLTIANEADRINRKFFELAESAEKVRKKFRTDMDSKLTEVTWFRCTAVPLHPIWLGRVIGRPELKPVTPKVEYKVFNEQKWADVPWGRDSRRPRPIVRGERRLMLSKHRALLDDIYSDGAVTLAMMNSGPRVAAGWILTWLAALVITIENMRSAAGAADAEYGIELAIESAGIVEFSFGDSGFFIAETYYFEPGLTRFPRYSFGPASERDQLINEMMQEILHSVGCAQQIDWGLIIKI